LSLPDAEEANEDPDADELYSLALDEEVMEYSPDLEAVVKEQSLSRRYALDKPSQKLQEQLKAFREYRTRILNAARSSSKVTQITVDGDVGVCLRFFGFVSSKYTEIPLDCGIFRSTIIEEAIPQFVAWLVDERKVSYSTVAGKGFVVGGILFPDSACVAAKDTRIRCSLWPSMPLPMSTWTRATSWTSVCSRCS